MFLETERLILRELDQNDFNSLYAVLYVINRKEWEAQHET